MSEERNYNYFRVIYTNGMKDVFKHKRDLDYINNISEKSIGMLKVKSFQGRDVLINFKNVCRIDPMSFAEVKLDMMIWP